MCFPNLTFNAAAMMVLDTSPSGMMNTQMNFMRESIITRKYLSQMPNPYYGCGYSMLSNGGNRIDYAQLAKELLNNIQSNCKFNWNWSGLTMPGMPSVSGTTTTTPTDPKQKEYQDIKNVLQKILNEKIFAANSEEEKAINEALTKTGNIDEKLQAVKDALTKIGSNPDAKKAIARIALSDKDIKIYLYDMGYNFATGNYGVQNDFADRTKFKSNDDLVSAANIALDELKNWHKGTGLSAIMLLTGKDGNPNPDIISNLSYLNRAADTEGGFIKLLVSKYKEDCDSQSWTEEEKNTWKTAMKGAYTSLRTKAVSINKDLLGESLKAKFNQALDDLAKYYHVIENGTKTDANINNYVNCYNSIYKMVRMIQAKKVDNDIASKFGYLNNTAAGIVPENVIVDETKTMLEAEKIGSASDIDVSEVKGNPNGTVTTSSSSSSSSSSSTPSPAKAKAERLTSGYLTRRSDIGPDVYETQNTCTSATPKSFYVVQGDKLIELKGATEYDKQTQQFEIDGDVNNKKTLEELVSANSSNDDVDEASIKNRTNFRKQLASKIKAEGKLKYAGLKGKNGEICLFKTGKTKLYIIVDDDIYKIKDYNITKGIKDGKIVKADGQLVDVSDAEREKVEITSL